MKVDELIFEAGISMRDVPYEDRHPKYENVMRKDYERLQSTHKRLRDDPNSFENFKKEIEDSLGSKLSKKEMRDAYHEWQQGGTEASEIADWFTHDRGEEEDYNDINSFVGDENDENDDATDYSMRQGEMGFPDRQR